MNEEINKEEIELEGSIKRGVLYVLLAHVIFAISLFLLGWVVLGLGIWLIQFIYVIPMAIHFKKQKQTFKGILITSGITFLLGGGICGVTMLPNMFR